MKNMNFFIQLTIYGLICFMLISIKNTQTLPYDTVTGRDPSAERQVIEQKRAQLNDITQRFKAFRFDIRPIFIQLKSDRIELIKKITTANDDAKTLANAKKRVADAEATKKSGQMLSPEIVQAKATIERLEKTIPDVFKKLYAEREALKKKITQTRNDTNKKVSDAKKEIQTLRKELFTAVDRFKDKGQQVSTDAKYADDLKTTIIPQEITAANNAINAVASLEQPQENIPPLAEEFLPMKDILLNALHS